MKTPAVSVVMAVYNGQEYLNIAIDSILMQSFKDFELVIVNDGSSDSTESIINTYSDPRIVYVSQKNAGLANALNTGIAKAKGKYIARMDADDVAYFDRLKLQSEYLDKHKKVGLVGTSYDVIEENNVIIDGSYHLDQPNDLKLEFLVRNPFGHGTIMARAEAFEKVGGYDPEQIVEDYELWWRISKHFQVANIANKLYAWRVVSNGISHSGSEKRQIPISNLMSLIWQKSDVKLPTSKEILASASHYDALGEKYLEQYKYMLAAITIALFNKKRYRQSLRLYSVLTIKLGAKNILKDLTKSPRSHNYNLSNLKK